MERSVNAFRERLRGQWLEKSLQEAVCESFEIGLATFSLLPRSARVLLVDDDKKVFIGGFLAAVALERAVFVGNPAWGKLEWAQVGEILQPDLIWGTTPLWSGKAADDDLELSGKIMIPTGGSGGCVRFAYHTWEGLMVSVAGNQAFMGGGPIDSCCVLPLYHVSGLMQVLRTFITGGRLFLGDWKGWVLRDLPKINWSTYSLSLVPTQLSRLLEVAGGEVFLRGFKAIFLGGAPASAELLERGRALCLPLSPTYGMTETAAMITAVQPNDFLAGEGGVGCALPHVDIAIEDGGIVVRSQSLFQGYFPQKPCVCVCYDTGDTGVIDAEGRLSGVRRRDAIIITGGEKVDPRLVEDALLAIKGVTAAHVLGLDDPDWGKRVGVVYVAEDFVNEEDLKDELRKYLASYAVPKSWARVKAIPVDEKGKVQARELFKTTSLS